MIPGINSPFLKLETQILTKGGTVPGKVLTAADLNVATSIKRRCVHEKIFP